MIVHVNLKLKIYYNMTHNVIAIGLYLIFESRKRILTLHYQLYDSPQKLES